MGTHGRTGIARVLLGSTAEGVVRHAPCSVLAVRSDEAESAVCAGCCVRSTFPTARSRPWTSRPRSYRREAVGSRSCTSSIRRLWYARGQRIGRASSTSSTGARRRTSIRWAERLAGMTQVPVTKLSRVGHPGAGDPEGPRRRARVRSRRHGQPRPDRPRARAPRIGRREGRAPRRVPGAGRAPARRAAVSTTAGAASARCASRTRMPRVHRRWSARYARVRGASRRRRGNADCWIARYGLGARDLGD